jgi:hypothetical protein
MFEEQNNEKELPGALYFKKKWVTRQFYVRH